MDKQYGFYVEEYSNGESIDTLMTGDGKTQFTDIVHSDGTVGLGMSYGRGVGVGTKEDYPEKTLATDIDIKFQVRFESQGSIDSMIETLLRLKNKLNEKAQVTESK